MHVSYGDNTIYHTSKEREINFASPESSKGTDYTFSSDCAYLRIIECQPFEAHHIYSGSDTSCSVYPLLFDQVK